jgi:hypothetical protein
MEKNIGAQPADSDICYDVPPVDEASKSAKKKDKKNGNKHHEKDVTTEELYNVPPVRTDESSRNMTSGGELYENLQNKNTGSKARARVGCREDSVRSRRSFPPHGGEFTLMLEDQTYDIPPPNEPAGGKAEVSKPSRAESRRSMPVHSSILSAYVADQTYDVPPLNEVEHHNKARPGTQMAPSQVYSASAFLEDQTYDTPPPSSISAAVGKLNLSAKKISSHGFFKTSTSSRSTEYDPHGRNI